MLRNKIGQFTSLHKLVIKVVVVVWLIAGTLGLVCYGLNVWNSQDRKIQKPIVILIDAFTRPILISNPKQVVMVYPTIKVDPVEKDLTPIEKYICEKFGIYDCKIMIAIAKAESGMKADAFHINSNGTIDVGIFQINSSHFAQKGCSLSEAVDPLKNIDCAYSIYKASGITAWAVYNNGSYLAHY